MSDVRVLLSAVLLAMGVSAAVSAGFIRHADDTGPRIVTVRLAELAAEHVLQAADAAGYGTEPDTGGAVRRALVPDTIPESRAAYDARKTRVWAVSLENALDAVAARHGAVLLPAHAVAAGAVDVTREVILEMELISQALDAAAEQGARP